MAEKIEIRDETGSRSPHPEHAMLLLVAASLQVFSCYRSSRPPVRLPLAPKSTVPRVWNIASQKMMGA